MTIGTVKFFSHSRGFGFIEPEDGSKDAVVHISAMERAGISSLSEGQKVEFDLQPGRNGKSSAENLKLVKLEKLALRLPREEDYGGLYTRDEIAGLYEKHFGHAITL